MPDNYAYNEKKLLQKIAEGDEKAMHLLFKNYYPKLYFFAHSLIDNYEESKDIAQQSLIQFWDQRAKFSDQKEENLAAYLFTVVKRDCYDYLKHQKVKRIKQKDIISKARIFEESTDSHIIYIETLQKIYQEIENLPPSLAEIVTLSFIEDLSTQEISERLQMTPNHVRVLKSRALEKLRNAFLKRNLVLPSALFMLFF